MRSVQSVYMWRCIICLAKQKRPEDSTAHIPVCHVQLIQACQQRSSQTQFTHVCGHTPREATHLCQCQLASCLSNVAAINVIHCFLAGASSLQILQRALQ